MIRVINESLIMCDKKIKYREGKLLIYGLQGNDCGESVRVF
jgi:hypothetical protein